MLFQLGVVQEIQFLLYITTFTLGVQLACYFLYRYYKVRKINLQTNRILLSFASFILLIIPGMMLLVINKLFVIDPFQREYLIKATFGFFIVAPLFYLYFSEVEQFLNVNKNFTKLIGIFHSFLLLIVIFSPEMTDFLLMLLLFLLVPGSVYISYFQIKLINSSFGKIKIYFIFTYIGESFFFASLYLGTIEIMSFISSSFLFAGLLFIFFAIFNYPEFLEFKWTDALSALYIIDTHKKECIYNYDFYKKLKESKVYMGRDQGGLLNVQEWEDDLEMRECINCGYGLREEWTQCPICQTLVDPNAPLMPKEKNREDIFSGGLVGIDSIISTITNTEDEKINKIKQGNSLILLEHGSGFTSQLDYVLIVRKEQKSFRMFLNTLKNQFESFYKEILLNLNEIEGTPDLLFLSFDIIIENIVHQR